MPPRPHFGLYLCTFLSLPSLTVVSSNFAVCRYVAGPSRHPRPAAWTRFGLERVCSAVQVPQCRAVSHFEPS